MEVGVAGETSRRNLSAFKVEGSCFIVFVNPRIETAPGAKRQRAQAGGGAAAARIGRGGRGLGRKRQRAQAGGGRSGSEDRPRRPGPRPGGAQRQRG